MGVSDPRICVERAFNPCISRFASDMKAQPTQICKEVRFLDSRICIGP